MISLAVLLTQLDVKAREVVYDMTPLGCVVAVYLPIILKQRLDDSRHLRVRCEPLVDLHVGGLVVQIAAEALELGRKSDDQ